MVRMVRRQLQKPESRSNGNGKVRSVQSGTVVVVGSSVHDIVLRMHCIYGSADMDWIIFIIFN